MDHGGDLSGRHTVERVHVDHARRVAAVEDLQTPRDSGLPAVQLLVEIVAEPADRLCQHDARRDGVAEGRQRNPPAPAGDPRAHAAECHRTPDAEAALPDPQCSAQSGPALAEVRPPVGDEVVEPASDEAERDGPHGDVVDHAPLAAASHPATIADHQGDDDPGDDAQRIRADRDRAEVPHALRRTRKGGEHGRGHVAGTFSRTPAASFPVSVRTAGTPSESAETSAEPTMTPSA